MKLYDNDLPFARSRSVDEGKLKNNDNADEEELSLNIFKLNTCDWDEGSRYLRDKFFLILVKSRNNN